MINSAKKTESFVTVTELAGRLGLSRMAIHKWIKLGKLHAEKAGNAYLIPVDQIKVEIERGVAKVVKEYGETLRRLGKE
jgi:excisionase family DNA binding protein